MKLSGFLMIALLGMALAIDLRADTTELAHNPTFERVDGYELNGSAVYRRALLDPHRDAAGRGVALSPSADGASVAQTIAIDTRQGRSFRFRFRGLPQDGFAVAADGLSMAVEFSGDGGRTAYDGKRELLYPLVQQSRRDLGVNGNGRQGGAAVWREYALTFYVPFPQVDRLKLIVGCRDAAMPSNPLEDKGIRANGPVVPIDTAGRAFLVTDFSLTRLDEPEARPSAPAPATASPAAGAPLPLGGRWYYRAATGETRAPAVFDHSNADRLLYRDGPNGGYTTPFAGNMSAVLHAGNETLDGDIARADQPVADNVTVRFEPGSLVLHTHGLPNHPTGRFPEDGFGRGNPNYIQEQDETYRLPLEPKVNPGHTVTTTDNSNHALNMGPIGVAVNGVVFFNPFDAGNLDASNLMDRCCGHPNQDGQYHYHKYPVCLNSPWSDEGKEHSPLLGWAFDGYPIYGPYESANLMAKDVVGQNALNAFNLHYDAQRGWHYHVTPGRFPYLIGGYWGQVERRNVRPPPGRGPGPEFGGPPPDL